MRLKVLIIILFLSPIWIYAQSYAIHLKVDTRYTKSSDIAAITKMILNGQEYVYSVSAKMVTNYDIVKKTTNGYEMGVSLDAINSELSSNGVKMSFDSQKDTLRNIDDTLFAKPLSDILGEKEKVLIDSLGVILQSDTSQRYRQAKEYITSTLLLGNDYSVGKKLDIIFPFKDSIKVGSSWIDSISVGGVFRIDTFLVENILNKMVLVSIKGQISRTLPVQQGGLVTMAHFVGNTNATLHVSRSTCVISSRKMKTTIHSQINVNNIDIPISSEIQLSEVVQ